VGTLVADRAETPTARTLVIDVPEWPGHQPGQHVTVRLTAPDGYRAQRSYSIASAAGPASGTRVEISVQAVPAGEVSGYLTGVLAVGEPLELRGPFGGWFVWRPESPAPVLLVGGGSGVVPLMSMVRTRATLGVRTPFRLLASVRTPADLWYAAELRRRHRDDRGLDVAVLHTREAPPDTTRPPGRINADDLARDGWPPELQPDCFVCGPTGFVERVADLLVAAGHDPARVRTERFGPTGG
jgi:ferredoxin-NADP reductase